MDPATPPSPSSSSAEGSEPVRPASLLARFPWAQLLLIAAATVLAYSNTFDATFHFDDAHAIVENPDLRFPARLWPPNGPRWIADLTFALNYQLGGLDVRGYHVINVLIHVCNALLLFALAATTLRTPRVRNAHVGPLVRRYLPLVAGLLFALHPLQTQAVTYIVQRFASLATLFYLASILLYARSRLADEAEGSGPHRSRLLYALCLVSAAAALMTKEIAVTLPVVAAGYEWLFLEGPLQRRARLLLPLAAATLIVPIAHLAVGADDPGRLVTTTDRISRSTYLLTQIRVVATYLRLLVLPVDQNVDYDFPLSELLVDPRVLLSGLLLASVAGLSVWALVRARRAGRATGVLLFFGTSWLFVTLSVESSLIPIRDVIFEHRMYLPMAGACLGLGAALLGGIEALRLGAPAALQCAVALALTAAPLGAATWVRNRVWKDELSLWTDIVAKSPGKARPHNSLGVLLLDRGRLDEAISELQAALRARPWYPEALYNLGNAYREKGELDEALRMYALAVQTAPNLPDAHNNLGALYELKGRLDEAEREYREAVRLAPGMAEAQNNLQRLSARARMPDAAP